ncbi:uncharacterized protein LOC110449489 isoform X2 [Mizuhopecten yessoensis]|uniref:uncharacterized protein LOC110449489 isoform X2 n=1 Tax=Mizuhopecten yessoensis TaxID=6573 RepID=UPI000B45E6DB|nr:uncharacterized protein LOC110449489 isoform X2 [Mizuhopecten yessoensis]
MRVGPSAGKKIDVTSALCLSEELVKIIKRDEQRNKQENKRMKQREKDFEALQNEKDTLQKENKKLESKCQQTDELLEVIQTLKTENNKHKEDLKRKQVDVSSLTEHTSEDSSEPCISNVEENPGEVIPNVPDLSDPNRAMKLGEKYNELFDNEWTDALETLCRDGVDEDRNIKNLLDVLQKCYSLCQDLSEKQMTSLEMVLLNPGASVTPTNTNYPKQVWGDAMISKSTYKQLKDCRKEVSQKAVGNIFKEHARAKLGWIAEDIPDFVKGCIEVCWLMCTQDPPVFIGSEADVGSAFDGNVYKPYTISGTIVSYNVWPPLLLHKNGPLLVKGIVQPIKVPRAKKNTEESKHKTTVVADRLKKNFGETYNSPYGQKSTQRETATKPTKYYEKAQLDRNFTSPPREKYYNGSHTGKNYEELRSHNAVEARGSPVHLTTHSSNYGSRHEPYGTTTQTNYHQDVVRHTSEPYKFEYRGRTYVYKNDHAYPMKEYQQIFGTTRGVSDL